MLALFRSEKSVVPQFVQKPWRSPLSDANPPTGLQDQAVERRHHPSVERSARGLLATVAVTGSNVQRKPREHSTGGLQLSRKSRRSASPRVERPTATSYGKRHAADPSCPGR